MKARQIEITIDKITVTIVLNNSETANLLWDSLPLESLAQTWGDEIYFKTNINHIEDDANAVVELGDVAFWPPGQAICLFFGPTPISSGNEIKPASPVNLIGEIDGDIYILKKVLTGNSVRVKRV